MYRDKNIHCKDEILSSFLCWLLIDNFFFKHVNFKRYKIFSASLVFYCEKICDMVIGFWLWRWHQLKLAVTIAWENQITHIVYRVIFAKNDKKNENWSCLKFTHRWLWWGLGVKGGKNKTWANISCIQNGSPWKKIVPDPDYLLIKFFDIFSTVIIGYM